MCESDMPNQALKISQISIAPRDLDNGCGESFWVMLIENSPIFLENSMIAPITQSDNLNYFLKNGLELMSMICEVKIFQYFSEFDDYKYNSFLFEHISKDLRLVEPKSIKFIIEKYLKKIGIEFLYAEHDFVYKVARETISVYIDCRIKKSIIYIDDIQRFSFEFNEKQPRLWEFLNFSEIFFKNCSDWYYTPNKQQLELIFHSF